MRSSTTKLRHLHQQLRTADYLADLLDAEVSFLRGVLNITGEDPDWPKLLIDQHKEIAELKAQIKNGSCDCSVSICEIVIHNNKLIKENADLKTQIQVMLRH